MKYKRRPVVVDAERVEEDRRVIKQFNGIVFVPKGDYIITESDGRIYSLSPKEFNRAFEPIITEDVDPAPCVDCAFDPNSILKNAQIVKTMKNGWIK